MPQQAKRLKRPVLAEALVWQSWFEPPATTGGVIESVEDSAIVGGIVVAAFGWDPKTGQFTLLTPWPTWADRGLGRMSAEAATRSLHGQLRSIEAVRMPEWE